MDKKTLIENSTGLILDGVFASQVWDSSGEVLDVEGCDISDMVEGRGVANYEHRNDESPGATAQDIVGKIVFAKKIMKASDAADYREKYFWRKLKVPFVYGMVRLYDGAGHVSAQGLAAQIRDNVKNKEPITIRFSIDGSTIEKEGNRLKYTLGRRVALTIKPCNNTCDSEMACDPNAPEGYTKGSSISEGEAPETAFMSKSELSFLDDLQKGEKKPKAESDVLSAPLPLQHFSHRSDLTRLDPAMQGSGRAGAEKNRPARLPRVYLYTDPGTPEKEVTGSAYNRYHATLPAGSKLYDMGRDPQNLLQPYSEATKSGATLHYVPDLDDVERTLHEQGYHGYKNYGVPSAVALFHPIDVTPAGTVGNPTKRRPVKKTLDAGMGTGAPGTLTGGAALQTSDIDHRIKKAIAAYDGKRPLKEFLKAELPDVSDSYLDHFSKLATELQAKKLTKADTSQPPADRISYFRNATNRSVADTHDDVFGAQTSPTSLVDHVEFPPKEPAAAATPATVPAGHLEGHVDDEDKTAEGALTIRGAPVAPNPDLKRGQLMFNEHTGDLHTPQGTFRLYNPDDDGVSGELFRKVWNSPEVRKQHDYATRNWIKLNQAMKSGQLPEAVLATSVAFSQLSPNTPVPMHELMYAHLLDTFKHKGFDIRDPRFKEQDTRKDWLSRDKPDTFPESSRDYFEHDIRPLVTNASDSVLTGRKQGEIGGFMLAQNKFNNMARYSDVHSHMKDLAARHGIDARGAVTELMKGKAASKLWESARKRAVDAGKPDIGPYRGLHIPGLAPKTARFSYAMMGAGNSFVPDTHFSRHLFGLDKSTDAASIDLLRNKVLWNEKNSELLNSMDRWYYRNHPAVKLMLEHPEFGSYFKSNPEQAVFPAFWGHWLAISPHERAMGHSRANVASNMAASHRPLFDEVDRLMSDPTESKNVVPARTTPIPGSPEPSASPLVFPQPKAKVKKSDAEGQDHDAPLIDPKLAAALLQSWVNTHGEAEALFRYYLQLLPLLMHASPVMDDESSDSLLKMEALSVDVARISKLLKNSADFGGVAQDVGMSPPRQEASPMEMSPATKDYHRNAKGQRVFKPNPDVVARYGSAPAPQETPAGGAFSVVDGLPSLNNTQAQKDLIHGLSLGASAERPEHAKTNNINASGSHWLRHPDGRLVFAKNDANSFKNGAVREVAYHNLARDFFGLGDYVPLTAMASHPDGNGNYSFQEAVPDSEHYEKGNRRQQDVLKALGDRGELHKLALMNAVLGNGDRHEGNYVFDKHGIKMIDHGHTFADPEAMQRLPHYLFQYEKLNPHGRTLHPEAKKWLQGLDPKKLEEHVNAMQLGSNIAKGLSAALTKYKERWLGQPGVLPRPINFSY